MAEEPYLVWLSSPGNQASVRFGTTWQVLVVGSAVELLSGTVPLKSRRCDYLQETLIRLPCGRSGGLTTEPSSMHGRDGYRLLGRDDFLRAGV